MATAMNREDASICTEHNWASPPLSKRGLGKWLHLISSSEIALTNIELCMV